MALFDDIAESDKYCLFNMLLVRTSRSSHMLGIAFRRKIEWRADDRSDAGRVI